MAESELDIAAVVTEVDNEVVQLQSKYLDLKKKVLELPTRSIKDVRFLQEEVSNILALTSVALFQLKLVNWKLFLHQRVLYGEPVSLQRSVSVLRDEVKEMSGLLISLINALSELSRNLRSMSSY